MVTKPTAKACAAVLALVASLCGLAPAWAGGGGQTNLPPEGSPPLMRNIELRSGAADGALGVTFETYLFYMEVTKNNSVPSQGRWVPYTEATERILRADFYRLWNTGFLDNLKIEVVDDPWPNGVMGKRAIFTMTERPRIRYVTFEGSTVIKRSDIDTAMVDLEIELRLDSFLDLETAKRIEDMVEVMFSAKGYQFADVRYEVEPIETANNAVRVVFHLDEGPKVAVQSIEFVGNDEIDSGKLKSQMKQIKERWWLSWITGRGTYKAALFEQDADAIIAYYLGLGYIDAAVGSPETEYLNVIADLDEVESLSQLHELAKEQARYGTLTVTVARSYGMRRRPNLDLPQQRESAIRWLWRKINDSDDLTEEAVVKQVNALARSDGDDIVQLMTLRIPVDEGERYRVGEVSIEGNEVVTDFGIETVFSGLKPGEYYSQEVLTTSLELSREVYGSLGYTDLTIFPDLQRRNVPDAAVGGAIGPSADGEAAVDAETDADEDEIDAGGANEYAASERPTHIAGDPVVDIVIRIEEGVQQTINRITFAGNESTRDEVIRRELQLFESGVFSTTRLKNSVLRVNQLGYFEPFEEDEVGIEAAADRENAVDLTFDLTEANLNQLSFGAGASQFDGFFGQVSYLTSNFLGRGETLQVSIQNGSRFRDINLGYTKPYLFGKPLSGGINLFSRRIEWIGAFTQLSEGGGATVSHPVSLFTRFYLSYSLEKSQTANVNKHILEDGGQNVFLSPFIADALLLGTGGRRTVSKITPSIRFNTVDHPIFPSRGQSYTAALELAGIGGNTRFLKPLLEGIWFRPHTSRTLFGFRVQYQHIASADPKNIPVFERLWLGGEYSLRGFDLRRIGPTVADIEPDVAPESYTGRTIIGGNKSLLFNAEYQITIAEPVRLIGFYDIGQVQDFGNSFSKDGFRSSTGVEMRVFLPMLNIPFRLIYSWNPQRDGVYNDRLEIQEATGFRFAVGTTF